MHYSCASDIPGAPQAACGAATGACQDNLGCDFDSGLCEPTQWLEAGASCATPTQLQECRSGLRCSSRMSCAAPLPAGSRCDERFDLCATGLACLGGDCYTGTCTAPIWVDDGQTLTTKASLCLHGGTSCGAGGACPTLIPNGQPCDPSSTNTACDDFSQCVNGTCQVVGPLGCQSAIP